MRATHNPRAFEIQKRFFDAFAFATASGQITGLQPFCEKHSFNRTKYSRIKNTLHLPSDEMTYKLIDLDALAALCEDFDVSAEWLLLGRGEMFRKAKKQ